MDIPLLVVLPLPPTVALCTLYLAVLNFLAVMTVTRWYVSGSNYMHLIGSNYEQVSYMHLTANMSQSLWYYMMMT